MSESERLPVCPGISGVERGLIQGHCGSTSESDSTIGWLPSSGVGGSYSGEGRGAGIGPGIGVDPDSSLDPEVPTGAEGGPAGGSPGGAPLCSLGPKGTLEGAGVVPKMQCIPS